MKRRQKIRNTWRTQLLVRDFTTRVANFDKLLHFHRTKVTEKKGDKEDYIVDNLEDLVRQKRSAVDICIEDLLESQLYRKWMNTKLPWPFGAQFGKVCRQKRRYHVG